MTPNEKALIEDLFSRLRANPGGPRDAEAEQLIASEMAKSPGAAYALAQTVLAELPYEWWVERYGELCGICGSGPSESRRLDRDHDHKTGQPRGLLCHTCNRRLWHGSSVEWLTAAAGYLERSA